MSETTQITEPLLKYAKARGCYGWKTHGTAYALAGNPDLIFCIGGLFVGIETKLPGEGPTAIQRLRLREIRQAGGRSYVVNDLPLGKLLIDWLISESKRLGSRFLPSGPVLSFAPPELRREIEVSASPVMADAFRAPQGTPVRRRKAAQ